MEKIKRALKPFAEAFHQVCSGHTEGWADRKTDQHVLFGYNGFNLTLGMLKNAADALSELEGSKPKEQGAEPVKGGCIGADKLVRVHGKDETCDVCASPSAREKAMERAGDAMDELLDGPWFVYDENREKAISVWRAAKSTK